MRFLVCPDKFKGSLTALEAAEAIGRGLSRALPGCEVVAKPIADGGEGTAEALVAALGGRWETQLVHDPLGREVEARYGVLPGNAAILDMSEASGLWRLALDERDPLRASTFGTGELIFAALRGGVRKIFVGLGGSATNDGGIGMAAALGFRFLDSTGRELPPVPANFLSMARIVAPSAPIAVEIVALSDVTNPLTGEQGASRVFGPQKGADPAAVAALDAGLARLADLARRDLGCDFREAPGAGAAGGLGFGLMSFCGATVQPGFETVARILGMEAQLGACDAVVTGEGSLDAQTLSGKGPAGVAAMARRQGKPVYAFAGRVADDPRIGQTFDGVFAITPLGMPLAEAMREAPRLLELAALEMGTRLFTGLSRV